MDALEASANGILRHFLKKKPQFHGSRNIFKPSLAIQIE